MRPLRVLALVSKKERGGKKCEPSKRSGSGHCLVIGLALALVGASAITFAAAASTGVIYACVNNSSGTIQVVSAADTCKANEVALTWNQQGPTGPQGVKGDTGQQGQWAILVRKAPLAQPTLYGGNGSSVIAAAQVEPNGESGASATTLTKHLHDAVNVTVLGPASLRVE